MGILNVTPDSFSDGGRFATLEAAVAHGVEMAAEGADILDVGGESTRPGADPVSEAEELNRVVPVVTALARQTEVPISIDTTKAAVARAAMDAGAVIVNDVTALRADPAMAGVVRDWGAGVVLMHMLGEPRTMQAGPRYGDVLAEVTAALVGWAEAARAAGIDRERIALDPGIGFGKSLEHNLALLRGLPGLAALGYPLLLGVSRKSFMQAALGLPVDQREEATAAAVAWCVAGGASIVRVHDVLQMLRVVRMTEVIQGPRAAQPPRPANDRIVIRGLRVFGHHGLTDRESVEGQDFLIDVELHLDLAPAGHSDDLSQTVDYSELTARLSAIVAGERYNLIETLAERLAAEALSYPRVDRAVVRVGKPKVAASRSAEMVLVEIERSR